MKVGISHILEYSDLRTADGEIIYTAAGFPIRIGTIVDRPTTIPIRNACKGYYLRWWYNGWHYWFFRPGEINMITEGEEYRTIGTRKVTMGSGQISYNQVQAIRTILLTREVYILTSDGWKNIRVEQGSVITYKNQINGYEQEIITTIGSREISPTGYSPVDDIPEVDPGDPGLCEVIIGSLIWSCKNYDSKYPGSKVYNDDESNRAIYGGLYTWAQINASGFAPFGWHVATLANWQNLITEIGGLAVAGGELKEVGTDHWDAPNTGAVDTYGFTLLPNGYGWSPSNYYGLGLIAAVWTATEYDGDRGYFARVFNNSAALDFYNALKTFYLSVRLVKDTAPIFDDWFLPSLDESIAMYNQLHLFGMGGFSAVTYLTSTENGANGSSGYSFAGAGAIYVPKGNATLFRACRYFIAGDIYVLRDGGPADGYIFHKIDLGGGSYGYYESAPPTTEDTHAWSNITNVAVTGTGTAIGTGSNNTDLIIAQPGHTDSAAKLCKDLVT